MSKYTLKPGKTTSGEIYKVMGLTAEYQCQFCPARGLRRQERLVAMIRAGKPFQCVQCKAQNKKSASLGDIPIIHKEYAPMANGRQGLMLTINCSDCSEQFTNSYATFKRLLGKHTPLRCQSCSEKAREASERLAKGSVSQQTKRAFSALSPQQQVTAETIIRDHVRACVKLNVPIDSIDRVWIEAIEMAQMEMSEPKPEPEPTRYEPTRRYPQYQSPRETSLL